MKDEITCNAALSKVVTFHRLTFQTWKIWISLIRRQYSILQNSMWKPISEPEENGDQIRDVRY